MNTYLTNNQIYALILLIFYSLVKSILHFIRVLNYFNFNDREMSNFVRWNLLFSDIMNIIFIILSMYLIFIKNIKSTVYFAVCILLLFKGLLHFITDYKIYKYFNFNLQTQQKIEDFHYKFSNISDLGIGLVSLFLLFKII